MRSGSGVRLSGVRLSGSLVTDFLGKISCFFIVFSTAGCRLGPGSGFRTLTGGCCRVAGLDDELDFPETGGVKDLLDFSGALFSVEELLLSFGIRVCS